jgi:class 3 adenylate cyclase/ABC-type branched-subunit amino acid transport system substrate-binding protein
MVDDDEPAQLDVARRGGGATRGFLFCDLRDYTQFVDDHGAPAAADLLERYRPLVRAEVARHKGAEIRTEGDSFYVVFGSVSDALECGLAIVRAAVEQSAGSATNIRVGVGIHAGETVETPEGFVGQPVNIAARLCAMAPAGEVFVSDTVRALTQSVLPVSFVSRGRRRLKGVAEPVHVYSVLTTDQPRPLARIGAGRRLVLAGVVAAVALLSIALAGVVWLGQRPAASATGEWKIGLSLSLTEEVAELTGPIREAVELGVAAANASGRLAGVDLVVEARDDSGDGFPEDEARGAANAAAFVADERVIAMIGPWSSFVASEQIPITNEAGLLQCSPSNTDPGLTKPRAGALDLRASNPDRINYVRLPAAADIEAAAGASYAFHDLGARTALVIDDTQQVGRLVADGFQREFEQLGGQVARRALNLGAGPNEALAVLDSADAPDLVFFGGFTNSGAPEVKRAMFEGGHADIPFLGWDGLWDGSGWRDESFMAISGDQATGAYVSHPTVGIIQAGFERRYREAHGDLPQNPTYEYAAAAYACVEIIAQALEVAVAAGVAPADLRETVRQHVVETGNFDTVVGPVSFDENGDSLRQIVSFYRADPDAAGGAGDWLQIKQQDFGPAP